jgi:hypothetical protein
MQLETVLQTLYSSTRPEILFVLNQAIYITDFDKGEDTLLFHTGFRFRIQTGTPLDVFFDLDSKNVIIQPLGPYPRRAPQLIGFLGRIGSNKYLAKSYDWLITTINVPETKNSRDKNVLQGLYGCNMQDAERLILGNAPITHITVGRSRKHERTQLLPNCRRRQPYRYIAAAKDV